MTLASAAPRGANASRPRRDAALELGERARNLKHETTCGGRSVDRLLIKIEVDAAMLEHLNGAEQVD